MALARDAIVDAAIALLDEIGIDALSTRRLAERLGIKSASLYWHFRDKGVLLEAMAARMATEEADPDPGTFDTWQEWFAEEARHFRRALKRHRDGARVHAASRPKPQDLAGLERKIETLCIAGFRPEDAARAFLVMSRLVIGTVLEEQSAATPIDPASLEPYRNLAAARSVLTEASPDDDFDFGLSVLLAGLESRLRNAAASAPEGAGST